MLPAASKTSADPWPRVFGYHEVFHLLTVAAAVAFYVLVLVYVLPAPRP